MGRSRKKQPTEQPETIAGVKTADKLPRRLDQPEPVLEPLHAEAPPPQQEIVTRPPGPRQRSEWEPANVIRGTEAGRPFSLDQVHGGWRFKFPDHQPATEGEKTAMHAIGFTYRPASKDYFAPIGENASTLRHNAQLLGDAFRNREDGRGR